MRFALWYKLFTTKARKKVRGGHKHCELRVVDSSNIQGTTPTGNFILYSSMLLFCRRKTHAGTNIKIYPVWPDFVLLTYRTENKKKNKPSCHSLANNRAPTCSHMLCTGSVRLILFVLSRLFNSFTTIELRKRTVSSSLRLHKKWWCIFVEFKSLQELDKHFKHGKKKVSCFCVR